LIPLILVVSFLLLALYLIPPVIGQEPTPPPIPYPTSMTLTATPAQIAINGSTATLNATVYFSDGEIHAWTCQFRNPTNLGTLSSTWAGGSSAHPHQEVTLTSGAVQGIETVEAWPNLYEGLKKTVTVRFTAADLAPPSLSNPSAAPSVILHDNGRPRAAGSNLTRINVTVTDDTGIANVTINLSAIGGPAARSMTQLAGTNVWTVTTNATAGINVTSILTIQATDIYGKSNTTAVALEVLRRGDVIRDNVVDFREAVYIARYTVGLEPEASNPPSVFVADVVGNAGDPRGDGKVDMKDALYLAKCSVNEEPAP
jgi:hypothetical protein